MKTWFLLILLSVFWPILSCPVRLLNQCKFEMSCLKKNHWTKHSAVVLTIHRRHDSCSMDVVKYRNQNAMWSTLEASWSTYYQHWNNSTEIQLLSLSTIHLSTSHQLCYAVPSWSAQNDSKRVKWTSVSFICIALGIFQCYVFVFKWNLIFSLIHGTNVSQIKFKQNDEPLKYGPSQMQQYFVNA